MIFTRIIGLSLAICYGICEGQQAARSSSLANSSTLVLKAETAGTLFVDGKETSKVQAGQVLTIAVKPGEHLVSVKTNDGRVAEGIVSVEKKGNHLSRP